MRYVHDGAVDDIVANTRVIPVTPNHEQFFLALRWAAIRKSSAEGLEADAVPAQFGNGESNFYFRNPDDIRGRNVYLVVPWNPQIEDIDGLFQRAKYASMLSKDLGAAKVTVVAPYFPARQDFGHLLAQGSGKEHLYKGSGCTAQYLARDLQQGGVDELITLDLHSQRVFKYFADEWKVDDGRTILKNIPVEAFQMDYLRGDSILRHKHPEIFENDGLGLALVALDPGSRGRVDRQYEQLGLPLAVRLYIDKDRAVAESADGLVSALEEIKGEFDGAEAIVPVMMDDIISSGNTQGKGRVLVRDVVREVYENARIAGYVIGCTFMDGGGKIKESQRRLLNEFGPDLYESVLSNGLPVVSDEQTLEWKRRCSVLRYANLLGDAILISSMNAGLDPATIQGTRDLSTRYTMVSPGALLKPESFYTVKRHNDHILESDEQPTRRPTLIV